MRHPAPGRLGRLTRVSSAGQGGDDKLSLPEQDRLTAAACVQFGFTDSPLYCEGAISSQERHRPVLESAFNAIEKSELRGFAVAEINRLGRTSDPTDCGLILNRLQQLGALLLVSGRDHAKVITDSRLYDLSVPRDYLYLRDALLRAGDALIEHRERTLPPYLGRQQAGRYNGGPLPFWCAWETYKEPGSRKSLKRIVLDPDGRALALELFHRYLEHGSLGKTAVWCNQNADFLARYQQFTPPAGWTGRSISKCLLNPRLCGFEQYRRPGTKFSHGTHTPSSATSLIPSVDFPAVVSFGQWQLVRRLILGNTTDDRATRTRHPLTGILACPSCGNFMRVRQGPSIKSRSTGDRQQVHYYACRAALQRVSRRSRSGAMVACPVTVCEARLTILASAAHQIAVRVCKNIALNNAELLQPEQENTDMLQELELEARNIDEREERLLDLVEAGKIEPARLNARLAALAEEKAQLAERRASMPAPVKPPSSELLAYVSTLSLDDLEQLSVAFRLLFERIVLRRVKRGRYELEEATLIGGVKYRLLDRP